jgi:hypothetical protein
MFAKIPLHCVRFSKMDCCYDRQWKFMSSILARSVDWYQKFLSSIEYGRVSRKSSHICLETCRIFCRSSSFVSIESKYFVYVSFVKKFLENAKLIPLGISYRSNHIDLPNKTSLILSIVLKSMHSFLSLIKFMMKKQFKLVNIFPYFDQN